MSSPGRPKGEYRSAQHEGTPASDDALLLDQPGIAALIPHAGSMCLLDGLLAWDARTIRCRATGHRAAGHPLRTASGLLATNAIEYAAQAMALHGALLAQSTGASPSPGFLASARGVHCHRLHLHDLPGALEVVAERVAGDTHQLLYAFRVQHAGEPVADGRAAVVLNPVLASGSTPGDPS